MPVQILIAVWEADSKNTDTRTPSLPIPLPTVIMTRETREGWPLLTVETEVNGDSKRTN